MGFRYGWWSGNTELSVQNGFRAHTRDKGHITLGARKSRFPVRGPHNGYACEPEKIRLTRLIFTDRI